MSCWLICWSFFDLSFFGLSFFHMSKKSLDNILLTFFQRQFFLNNLKSVFPSIFKLSLYQREVLIPLKINKLRHVSSSSMDICNVQVENPLVQQLVFKALWIIFQFYLTQQTCSKSVVAKKISKSHPKRVVGKKIAEKASPKEWITKIEHLLKKSCKFW